MKWIYLFIPLFYFAQSFAGTNPTSPEQGRQIYNISNIKKNNEKEKTKQETIELENL